MAKENYFILQTYDEEKEMFVQFHYWTSGKYFFSSTELDDGTTASKKRISQKEYMTALETYYNA
jgi:hypothetical protein